MSFNFYEIAEEWNSAIGEGTPNTRNKKHMEILKEILVVRAAVVQAPSKMS